MAYTTAELEASLNGFTEKINDLDAGKFIINALFGGDANSLNEFKFNKSFLENIKKTLEDSTKRAGAEVEKVSKEKLKQMVDPFGLSDPKTAKEMKDKVAAYKNKINQFLDITLPEQEKDKNAALQEVLRSSSRYSAEEYELMRNAPLTQPNDEVTGRKRARNETEQQGFDLIRDLQKNLGSGGVEQKGFDQGETIVGSFSRNAKRDLLEVLQLDKMFEKLSSDIADKTDKKSKDKEKEKGSSIGDLLTNLLGGGIAAMFMGIVGFAGALMSDGPTKGFMAFIGKGGLKLGLGSMAKFFGGTFSKAVLKRMPIIGSLLSFALAYDYFKQGEYVDMALQIASGVANFVPGYGTALSVGIDVLQAVVDAKAGSGGTAEEKNSRKLDLLSNWGKNLYDKLKTVPFIKNIIAFGEGFTSLFTDGITGDNLDKMSEFPLLGIFPAILKSIWQASSWKAGEMPSFNWTTFSDGFSKTIKKAILSWIPDIPGLKKYVAGAMGVDLEGNSTDLNSTSTPAVAGKMKDAYKQPLDEKYINEISENFKKELEGKIKNYDENISQYGDQSKTSDFSGSKQYELKKQADEAKKMLEDSENLKKQAMKQEVAKKRDLQQKEYSKATNWMNKPAEVVNNLLGNAFGLLPDYQDPLKSKEYTKTEDELLQARSQLSILQGQKVDDFVTGGKVTITNTSGQSVTTSPDDVTYAAKDDGLIDKKLSALHKVFSEVNKNISILVDLNSQPKDNNNNSVVNISGGQQSKGYSSSSSALDHRIYHMKMEDSNRVAC